jgi:multicomponent Na+:H+ antiporter subunit G
VSAVLDVLSVALLVVGAAFLLGGTVGLVRLPDLYTRAHAASKCDSAGAGSILLALALQGGLAFGDLKLVVLMLLVLVSGPTTAHALARAGYRTGLTPWTDPERERA